MSKQRRIWRPAIDADMLRLRAQLLAGIRAFFAEREVLEVETPLLSHAGNPDRYIDSFDSRPSAHTQALYLHTSPEFAMKRLLAAGCGSIYQLCKVFRQGELGRLHNPEFTMLEWYRVGFDHHRLMAELEALLAALGLLDAQSSIRRISYRQLFEDYAGLDALLASEQELIACIKRHEIQFHCHAELDSTLDRDAMLALILTHIIEPQISQEALIFVYDFPASQASLARLRAGDPPVAERFELYAYGIELANGFHELTDSHEQAQRFAAEVAARKTRGLKKIPVDQLLVDALAAGMPDCAGVALGFDRLVMVVAGKTSLEEVLPFPFERA